MPVCNDIELIAFGCVQSPALKYLQFLQYIVMKVDKVVITW
jgi:hypothetical protein